MHNSKRFFSIFTCLLAVIVFLILVSCRGSASDEGENSVTYITINSDGGSEKLLGSQFTFTVRNNLNEDVTPASKIYVNGNLITGNTFTPVEMGTYSVTASYKELPVNPIKVNALLNDGVNFKHRILYEEFTGTWCGYCTVGLARHDNLLLQTQNFVFVGIHGPAGTNDPWASPLSTEFENFKGVSEWPTMYINRNTLWEYTPDFTNMALPLSQLNASSKIGIKVNSAISGNTLSADVDVLFSHDFTNLKIAAFVVEDKLVHDQKNYISTLYGGVSVIRNFVHHNVLRSKLTSIAGDAIPNSESVVTKEYKKNLQYAIPSGFNRSNLKIVVMILDDSGKVLNTREALFGENLTYEFL